jgi:hypothetical protein
MALANSPYLSITYTQERRAQETEMLTRPRVSILSSLFYQGDVNGRITSDGNATVRCRVSWILFRGAVQVKEKRLAKVPVPNPLEANGLRQAAISDHSADKP